MHVLRRLERYAAGIERHPFADQDDRLLAVPTPLILEDDETGRFGRTLGYGQQAPHLFARYPLFIEHPAGDPVVFGQFLYFSDILTGGEMIGRGEGQAADQQLPLGNDLSPLRRAPGGSQGAPGGEIEGNLGQLALHLPGLAGLEMNRWGPSKQQTLNKGLRIGRLVKGAKMERHPRNGLKTLVASNGPNNPTESIGINLGRLPQPDHQDPCRSVPLRLEQEQHLSFLAGELL